MKRLRLRPALKFRTTFILPPIHFYPLDDIYESTLVIVAKESAEPPEQFLSVAWRFRAGLLTSL